jgi:REP element-mobilizing transposase RayT
MPDHVHFLAEGLEQDADLKKFVSSFKQSTGYHFSHSSKAKAVNLYDRAKALGYNFITIHNNLFILQNNEVSP